ncbi:LuxR family transcriptional regulator [Scandinavium sp. V105_16]|uniref:LuxR family transcriptional regulator n=1 Tax=Scandinavium lactucae TaxID=3095028 RepID=A0AAJ2S2Q5_9ENTR|nr:MULTISPECIES: LuxR family transcriptional regulator [unclassified Scandinavium]MDX6019048.1 LuxR family transcriptional regulator [Scandinavium sp. V105_16]MDX6029990.1 LuxR family transcriptional regulator [Scandinavium sp. V105_12]
MEQQNLSVKIKRIFSDYLRESNLTDMMYTYLVLKKTNPSEIFTASTYPVAWQDIYLSNSYQFIDPVVLIAMNRITSFSWAECFSLTERANLTKVFTQSAKQGITGGYTFVLHDHCDNLAMLSFLLPPGDESREINIIENKSNIFQFLVDTHAYYLDITSNKKDSSFDKPLFSAREHEVFYWASKGKTNVEIGCMLGITLSTVKFHLRNICKKLGVTNSKHAIRLGIELNLIISP